MTEDLQKEVEFLKAELEVALAERDATNAHVKHLRKSLRVLEALIQHALKDEA